MKKSETFFFEKFYSPIIQGTGIFSFSLMIMLIVWILKKIGYSEISGEAFWLIAGTSILIFALFNSILSLATKNIDQYWTYSIPTYAVLMILSGGLAYLFSAMTMEEAGTFRWIFMVLTFGYLLFLSIMRTMRSIVESAQKEDDNWMKRMK